MPTTVFFATNRALNGPPEQAASYGATMHATQGPGGLTFGTAFVDGTDIAHNRQGQIRSIQDISSGGFAPNVGGDLAAAGRNLLVFIHGFDNSFEDAITRAAFNRDFLAASGNATTDTTVLAFSWPSQGRLLGFPDVTEPYRTDQQTARASGPHLMRFLASLEPLLLAARAGGCRTYLLAHSMGNLALESAVASWFAAGNGDAALFDMALLAAADCGCDAFGAQGPGMPHLSRLARRVAFYCNQRDEVLNVSGKVNALVRLGHDGPQGRTDALFPPAVYSLFDATGVGDYEVNLVSSHQYYRLSPTVRARMAADMMAAGR